ncbi:MAG TPA: type II toxin-antitoxin system VapC family toxin [Candidatus Acidoferrales bacterium]|nr:type II toxin-antitoxin system VapC family toxin [Candidatus Acidoferrales bacterium]
MTTPSGSRLVLVDSSGWVEYFGEGPKAARFAPYLERETALIVPSIVLYEVYKKLLVTTGKTIADRFVSQALRRQVIPLDEELALGAARVSVERRLAMADAIIYVTAQAFEADLVTSDSHFQNLPGATLL